ncbi:uncharacterized protein LOC121763940 [Salvia splendens]|uniref:uncharacterized protein LOC121763940 n=1 Tax=Salvia splendens TaxID=180675 RepID=UPI00110427D3|nr:uncharacterized protein LOC121763940 [Salvia splendens]
MERKRKVYLGESASSFHLKTQRVADSGSPPSSGSLSCQTVAGDDDAFTSCCSSNGSRDLSWKFLDLEDNEAILTTSTGDSLDCESETAALKGRGESDKLDPRRR